MRKINKKNISKKNKLIKSQTKNQFEKNKINLSEILELENYLIKEIKFEKLEIKSEKDEIKIFEKDFIVNKKINNKPSKQVKSYNISVSPYLLDLKPKTNDLITNEIKPNINKFKNLFNKLKNNISNNFHLLPTSFIQPTNKFFLPKTNNLKNFFDNNSFTKLNLNLRLKLALNFLLICLFIIAPIYTFTVLAKFDQIKEQVSNQSSQALNNLNNAARNAQNNEFQMASLNFQQAAQNFAEARKIINDYNNFFWKILNYLPIADKKINSAKSLLEAGEKISQTASDLTIRLNQLNSELNSSNLLMPTLAALINDLTETNIQLKLIINSINDLNEKLVPANYSKQYNTFKSQLPLLSQNLEILQQSLNAVYQILAPNEKKQYLIFFQNSNELRATGGFLGSFALITVENGEIKQLEIPGGGPYDLKGALTKKVISPEPMHLVGSRWQIWDANWWPDFPTSAEKIRWFYEASGGLTVDGVITINSNILPQLLNLTGDIYLEKYDKLMTSENIIPTIQAAVEFEYDKEENKPKQIIADLAPILIEKLLKINQEKLPNLLSILVTALKEKDLQMYFTDDLENKIIDLGWGGEIKNYDGDYLMVVNQNIGGGKTDQVVKQTIDHQSEVQEDGTIINTVKITRNHQGNINDIFEKINNVSYLRIYVPAGSKLLAINGYEQPPQEAFKQIENDYQEDEFLKKVSGQSFVDENSGTIIYNEFNKTVFGQWMQVKPGEEKTLSIIYQLPFKLKIVTPTYNLIEKAFNIFKTQTPNLENYNLLIQKQSGINNLISSKLILPKNKKINWATALDSQNLQVNSNDLIYNGILSTDQSYSVLIE